MKTYIPESLIHELQGQDKTIFVATESELATDDSLYPVVYTGTGRMNVYSALVRWWDSARFTIDPSSHVLVHIGHAVSRKFESGSLVVANTFVNGGSELVRDTIRTVSPGESEVSVYTCDFSVNDDHMAPEFSRYDLFDADAYAFARFCRERHLDMVCIKGIADNMDGTLKPWHNLLKDLHKRYARLAGLL